MLHILIRKTGLAALLAACSVFSLSFLSCRIDAVEPASGNPGPDDSIPVVPLEMPTAGLAAHWPFQGNADDSSGNGNHGRATGAILAADRFGKAAGAYQFDGVDDDIRVEHSPSLNITQTLTISLWIWFDTGPPAGSKLLHKSVAGEANGYAVADWATGYGSVSVGSPSFAVGTGAVRPLEAPSQFAARTWIHFAGTYDGARQAVFVNGAMVRDTAATGAIVANSQPLFIGNINRALANQPFKGRLDDIRIYNRALSAAEIKTLSEEGK